MPTRKARPVPGSLMEGQEASATNGVVEEPAATVTVGRIEVPRINI